MTDGGKTVSDDNACAAHRIQGIGHLFLGDVVKRAGCLIKDQKFRF
jgi:hypothetical protein